MKKTTFFSNEDLDNILRGMEGLTTDEKEAYLDARLKELESLPDSRKKELQEAARAGMQPTLELASHISTADRQYRFICIYCKRLFRKIKILDPSADKRISGEW